MYIIPAYWQSLWNALAQIATMIGAWAVGLIADRFGRRASFAVRGLISMAGIASVYTASSPRVFLAGKMNTGYFVTASIAFKRVTIMSTSAYKVLFASGWAWPATILVTVWFIPESSYYLVRKGDVEKARRMIQRLSKKNADASSTLESIMMTNEEEKRHAVLAADVSFLECFKGTNWRRTRIILYANGLSQMIGASFNAKGPYLLVSAGISPSNVAMMIEIGIAFGIVSSIVTFFCIRSYPRRNIILFGLFLAFALMIMIGIAGCFPHRPAALWTVGITLHLTWWTFGPVVGPATSVAGEVSVTRLRAKSQAIGFAFNYLFSTVWNVVVPYMFNPDRGNLGDKIDWIYTATCLIATVVIYFEFPETRNQTFIDLDHMFDIRLPSRKFAGFVVQASATPTAK